MKEGRVWFVILSLFCFTIASFGVLAEVNTFEIVDEVFEVTTYNNLGILDGDPDIEITYPESGYLYLFKLRPIKMPLSSALGLGYSVVIDRSLHIDTYSNEIHHVKFVAKGMVTGWETVRWDYKNIDGLSTDLGLSSGIYDITAYAFDELDDEVGRDSTKVLFIKVGRDDFGIWINTRYNGGEEFSTPLNIGLTEFGSMLNTGESKKIKVTMQNKDDTTVELRFTRTKIMDGSENVIETKFNIETECDTTKDYEASLEVRFPFAMLDGGQPSYSNNPYFSTKVGYNSYSSYGEGPNKVDTTFFFGRENIDDPKIFRMKLKPSNLDADSKLTFFTSYLGVDGSGNEVFQRIFSVGFEPATELTITTIPGEAKIRYDFGESAGVSTKISFRAEGGLLDDVIQSFKIDPLPGFMSFDLTLLGTKEFIYESDRSYDLTYSLDSVQNGNLVQFEVVDLPKRIHASCGIDPGEFGDLSVASFAELDMSSDVERFALYFKDNEIPFISIENFPRKLRYEGFIDIPDGVGNLSFYRGIDEVREININLVFDIITITKSFELKNNFIRLAWDINLQGGQGDIHIERDSDSAMAFSTSITIGDWIFAKSLELSNTYIGLSWDINREERMGRVTFLKDSDGGSPSITVSITHNDWSIVDTIELNNELIEVYWDLPIPEDSHAEIGLNTGGNEIFHNTLSLVEDSVELLSLGIGIQIGDNFHISWDNDDGVISNFEWGGNILNLPDFYVSVNLPGDVLTITGDWIVGDEGSFSLELNRDVDIDFVNVETDRFKVDGHISFNANCPLDISWEWGELGHFTVDTHGQAIGEDFSLSFYWDPAGTSNYRYGFTVAAPEFLDTYFHVDWWKDEQTFLPRFWVIWYPLPSNWNQWDKTLLWDYEWYEVPWPL